MSVGYVVTVHLLPQDTKGWEYALAATAAREKMQSIVYSADDAKRLAVDGDPGSTIHVWDRARWTQGDIVEWLAPCDCVLRWFIPTPTTIVNIYPRYAAFASWNEWALELARRTGVTLRRMNTSQPEADERVGWPDSPPRREVEP
jgi:hypothetical protein